MKLLLITACALAAPLASVGQDAIKTLPNNYRVTFENDYVRVTRVHYGPREKLPGHTHTSLPTAYVYLNDSGPVAFQHVGLDYGAVTRPPTVARSYRLFRGLEEIHAVENLSDLPSDFLRVEFKTDPGPDPRTLRGKYQSPASAHAASETVEFENVQLRIARLIAPPERPLSIDGGPRPSVLVALDDGAMGEVTWLEPGSLVRIGGTAQRAEALRFTLKTAPRSTR